MSSGPVDWKARIRPALAAGSDPDDDVIEELSQHAAAAYEAARADGQSTVEAQRQVDPLIAEWCRSSESLRRQPAFIEPGSESSRPFAGLVQDARHGLRLLRRDPGFTCVAIFTIALGIGGTTTLFSVAYGVLRKPLPWPNADRMMRVTEMRKGQLARIRGTITKGAYLAWRDQTSTTEAIGGYSIVNNGVTALRGGGEPVRPGLSPQQASAEATSRARTAPAPASRQLRCSAAMRRRMWLSRRRSRR